MIRYALARDILGSDTVVEIKQNEFESAEISYHQLQLAVAAEERFDAIARNFIDFESDMLTSTLENFFVGFGAGMEQMAILRLLNRRMLNLLSATRAYYDHMKHAAKILFNRDERFEEIIDRFSYHHDNNLSYRVLEALRNYSQHRGLPIHSVSYPIKVIHEKQGSPMKHMILPELDVGRIRTDGKFKASVLRELESNSNSQVIDLKNRLHENT